MLGNTVSGLEACEVLYGLRAVVILSRRVKQSDLGVRRILRAV